MHSSFSIPTFGVLLISILSENIESKAIARSSSKVVECRVDSISCAGRAGDENIDFSYCNKDLDCNNSSHSSVSVCSLGSGKVPSFQKLDLLVPSIKDGGSGGSSTMIQIPSSHFGSSKSSVGERSEISPKIHPKLEEDIEGSSENPLDKTGEFYVINAIDQLLGCLAPKRQVVDGSPRSLSPNGVSFLSREISFKNLDKGKVRPSPQISLGNHYGNDMQEVSTTSVPPASNSRLSQLPLEPAGFSYDHGATIDIPLDTASGGSHNQVAGIVVEEKNWPPFFPIIHHDIASEIPIHLQRLQVGSMPSVEHHSRYYIIDQSGRAMKLYTAQSGSNKRCPRQSGGTECGYYVSVGSNKEWKPKVINSNFGKGSGTAGASDVPTSSVEANAYS
ncbi:Secretory carrier-associated membrane protein 3 [Hibiscus syriacus]|uniref:Secretory carrier-associated membrane protein n=1 Tax=Hibiscus syriacus TaxID=106335 RepID=A0A6A2YKJ2_HIBSY|nr:Secretory carrier-associated membrane protein 3 [Hibiscus syriacus]